MGGYTLGGVHQVPVRVTHSQVAARGWMDLRSGNHPEALSCEQGRV